MAGTATPPIVYSAAAVAVSPLDWNAAWARLVNGTLVVGLNADQVDGAHVGTSGATIPLLSTENTWTLAQTFSAAPLFSTMTAGSVLFAGTAGVLSQDNEKFFWDDTNNFLGLGTNTPLQLLTINASASTGIFKINRGAAALLEVQGTNNVAQLIFSLANKRFYVSQDASTGDLVFGTAAAGSGTEFFRVLLANGDVGINGVPSASQRFYVNAGVSQTAGAFRVDSAQTLWYQTWAAFEIINANATTNNDALVVFSDNTSGLGTAGFGVNFSDRTNHYGEFYIWTKGTDGYNQRLIISSGGNVSLTADNQKLLFGAGNDASIYYDGTNLIVNPKEVGSGFLDVQGAINANANDIYTTGAVKGVHKAADGTAAVADGTYAVYNDGVTSGQVTSLTIRDGIITAIGQVA